MRPRRLWLLAFLSPPRPLAAVSTLPSARRIRANQQERANPPDDIVVLHFLEQRDLPDGSGRYTFIFLLEPDLLECDNLARLVGCVPGVQHRVRNLDAAAAALRLRVQHSSDEHSLRAR